MTDTNETTVNDEIYADDVGSIVIESTILKFLSTLTPDEQETFSKFVDAHAGDNDLIVKVGQTYPTFLTVLQEEITSLQKDIKEVTGSL